MFTYLINPLLCNWSCITVIYHYHLLLSATGALLILLSIISFVIPEILPRPWVDFLLLCTGSFSTLCCFHSLSFPPCSDSVLEHPPSHHAEVQDSPTPSTGPQCLDFDIQFWTVLIMDTLLIPPYTIWTLTPYVVCSPTCVPFLPCLDSDILCLATLSMESFLYLILVLTLCWAAFRICTAFSPCSCCLSSIWVPYSLCSDSYVPFCPKTHRCLPCSAPPNGFCTELLYWREGRGGEGEELAFFMVTMWSKFMFDRNKSSPVVVVDIWRHWKGLLGICFWSFVSGWDFWYK